MALLVGTSGMFRTARHILDAAWFALNPINKRRVLVDEENEEEDFCATPMLLANAFVMIAVVLLQCLVYLVSWLISCGAYSKYHVDMV
eukprot:45040_1